MRCPQHPDTLLGAVTPGTPNLSHPVGTISAMARQCSSDRKDWPGIVEVSHTRIMSSSSAGSKARIISEAYCIGRHSARRPVRH